MEKESTETYLLTPVGVAILAQSGIVIQPGIPPQTTHTSTDPQSPGHSQSEK